MTSTNYPPELEKMVLAVMESHKGRENSILRGALLWQVSTMGVQTNERSLRECIKQLRRAGHLILAMPGEHGGYYKAATRQEFEDFMRQEFGAKINDMLETKAAMTKSAESTFSELVQGAFL
jgi:hypothetical protein